MKGGIGALGGIVWLAFALSVTVSPVAQGMQPAESETTQEALRLGERMYREGILPNGKPMRAIVAGDVPVDGRMFSCANCHRRSGLGSLEGSVIAWPVNGKELWAPRRRTGAWNSGKKRQGPGSVERWSLPPRFQMEDVRPAYTDETLARVLRTGVDPGGRMLSRAMPRYDLDEQDVAVLSHYLKSLSGDIDPGADGKTLRFATVVTDGVSESDRIAMLSVLRAHIDARNTQTRPYERRASSGPFYKTESYGAYRKLALDVWALQGPADTWRKQLEDYYREQPVFALLGGIAAGSWAPVHEFCEDHGIPAIFPITDQPVVSESDWYTLYFSKGLYQEGEAAARFLALSAKPGEQTRILQLFRSGSKGEAVARGFTETWAKEGGAGLESRALGPGEPLSLKPRDLVASEQGAPILLLWLDGAELVDALKGASAQDGGAATVFASRSLAGSRIGEIPEAARTTLLLTYPQNLPGEGKRSWSAINRWLQARHIPEGDPVIQAKMYFLGWMLPGAISDMRSEFYRDYFLEAFDMMVDQDYAIPVYPRLSFGPDQRYAAKGCFIVQLSPGDEPQFIKASNWIVN